MRLTRSVAAGIVFAAFTSAFSREASAQERGFALDRLQPSERGSQWFALDSLDLRGQHRFAAGIVGGWAHDPLVLRDAAGDRRAAIVSDQLVLHPGASLVLVDRFRFGLDVPVGVYQNGDSGAATTTGTTSPNSASFGDIRATADVRLFGAYGGPVTAAAGVETYLPTGSTDGYSSDGTLRVLPRVLVAGTIGRLVYAGRFGVHVRPGERFAGSDVTTELVAGGAVGFRATDRLTVGPELLASTAATGNEGIFHKRNTPLEGLLGAHFDLTQDLRAGLAVGAGLSHGYGAPSARGLLSFEWVPPANEPARPHNEEGDAPRQLPPPPAEITSARLPDADGDGVSDATDACPSVPGIATTDPKTNGCPPDPDRDGDGIVDAVDACPEAQGAADPDPKKNGCPRAVLTATGIEILDAVKFRLGSAELDPAGDSILEAVRDVMAAHPEVTRVRIEGHTDNRGGDALNRRLSEARAAAVRAWLVQHGIASARLDAQGFGSSKPIESNETEEGRRENRRVAFAIEKQEAAR